MLARFFVAVFPEQAVPHSRSDIEEALKTGLVEYKRQDGGLTLLVIDTLEALADWDTLTFWGWLPASLPTSLRVVVGTRVVGSVFTALRCVLHPIAPLLDRDRTYIIRHHLARADRRRAEAFIASTSVIFNSNTENRK